MLLIAEIGNNHEGSFARAQDLVRAAADSGADAVKFQTFRTEHYVSRNDAARFARLQSFELTLAQFADLAELARGLGLLFVSTPFDLASAAGLESFVDAYKIASGDNTFYPLLDRVARTDKPLILSTGLADLAQVRHTVAFVSERRPVDRINLAVLHCVTGYPVDPEEANVSAIRQLQAALDCPVGYSDHTLGTEAALIAVALGARIVEKHFTLDKNFSSFRDHQISADPPEFRALASQVRRIPALLGSGEKVLQPCERGMTVPLRRSIVAAVDLPAGHVVRLADLTWTRPGGGLAPGEEARVTGRILKKALMTGERVDVVDLEEPA